MVEVAFQQVVGGQRAEHERLRTGHVVVVGLDSPGQGRDRELGVLGVLLRQHRVHGADHGVDVGLGEELHPRLGFGEVRAGELVLAPAQQFHCLLFVAHHRVGPGLVSAEQGHRQLGTGLLGGDLAQLEQLQRVVRGVLVQVDAAHAVEHVGHAKGVRGPRRGEVGSLRQSGTT